MSVSIAIVDSGIDTSHRWLEGCVLGGIGLRESCDGFQWESEFDDLSGHGTSVAALIHAFCPEAALYAIRIVCKAGQVPRVAVLEQAVAKGIEWCVDQRIRIINVSYSLEQAPECGPLARACRAAFDNGLILVASYRNRASGPAFPAALSTVIGTRRDKKLDVGQISILSCDNRDLAAWGGPFRAAHLRNTIGRMEGTSYSCAQVAAMIGRMLTVDPSIDVDRAFELLREVARYHAVPA